MKNKLISNVFALVLILPLIDYSLPIISYYVFLPIVIYNIISIVLRNINIEESSSENETLISIKDAYKSFFITFTLFFFIAYCIYFIQKFIVFSLPFNFFIVLYYFYLLQNVSFRSLGHYCLRLKINNKTCLEKCKIILLNLLNSIIVFFLFFKKNIDIPREEEIKFIELFLVILIINAVFRILVLKHQSLFEYFLKIRRIKF